MESDIPKGVFHSTFKKLSDSIKNARQQKYGFISEVAEKFGVKWETAEKWYKGLSAPTKKMRNTVIEELYREYENAKKAAFIRKEIKNNLKIYAFKNDHGDVRVELYYADEKIYEDTAY